MPNNPPWLPAKFETLETAKTMRRRVVKAIARLPQPPATQIELTDCTKAARCGSGLCPICVRILRRKFLHFVHRKAFAQHHWYFVTVRVDGWTKGPGDLAPFGPYHDGPEVKALLDRLRRNGDGDAMIFGSIEVVFRTVANVPMGKPFHLHLMISGLSPVAIYEVINKSFVLDPDVARPLDIRPVRRSPSDFVRSASYVFAQPFWKESYPNQASGKGVHQPLKPDELAELIANLGAHPVGQRLILMGIRRDKSKFRLTQKLIGSR
jgi:hypothetical protein